MKKYVLSLMLLGTLGGIVYASCQGPYCWDDGGPAVGTALKLKALVLTPDSQSVSATAEIPVNNSYLILSSTGGFPGDVTFSAPVALATATVVVSGGRLPQGMLLTLRGSTTNQLVLPVTATLQIPSATVVISSTRTATFLYDSGKWYFQRGESQPQ